MLRNGNQIAMAVFFHVMMTAASSGNVEARFLQSTENFTRFYNRQNGIVVHAARIKLPQAWR